MPPKKKAKSKKTFFSAHEKRKRDPKAHEHKENRKSVCLPSPDLYTLTVEEFNDALNEFPLQKQHFIAEAGKRLDNMKMDHGYDEEESPQPAQLGMAILLN